MRRWRRIGRLVLGAIGMAALTSCLSDTAPTGPPPASGFETPEATLRTLEAALEAKGGFPALSRYATCFADSTSPETPAYHQFFDPADVTAFFDASGTRAPDDWGLLDELAFYKAFAALNPGDRYDVQFDVMYYPADPPRTDREALLYRRYLVYSYSAGRLANVAIGTVDLSFLRLADGRWVITRWQDHVHPDVGPTPQNPNQKTFGRRRMDSMPRP